MSGTASGVKLGAHDVVSVFLGLLSWLFPGIPEWIKILVTIFVMVVAIYLALSKEQKEKVGKAVIDFFDFIIPVVSGAVKGILIGCIVIAIADSLLGIHLIRQPASYFDVPVHKDFASLIFYTIGHLNIWGNIVLVVAIIIGIGSKSS